MTDERQLSRKWSTMKARLNDMARMAFGTGSYTEREFKETQEFIAALAASSAARLASSTDFL